MTQLWSRRVTAFAALVLCVSVTSSAWALVVSDAATTARNAITAALKSDIVTTVLQQRDRLAKMAARLGAAVSMDRYRADMPSVSVPTSQSRFVRALAGTDDVSAGYADSARSRTAVPEMEEVSAPARRSIHEQMATMDIADAAIIAAATQVGLARLEHVGIGQAIAELEWDVLNSDPHQSATAVLDKLSAAGLIEARQKQQRLQMLTVLTEQLLIEAKRSRDTEAGALNMLRSRLLSTDAEEGGFLTGAADDLRAWRQP